MDHKKKKAKKTAFKIGWKKKKVSILEFGFCWTISVEFISVTVRDRGNPSKYSWKLSTQSIKKKKTAPKLDEK